MVARPSSFALLTAVAALLLQSSVARAEGHAEDVAPSTSTPPRSYWEPGEARPFVSAKADVSLNYAKTLVAAGYGKPHWIWVGAESFAITTTEFGAVYGGVRASTPVFDVAFGYRDNVSYYRGFLAPVEHHTLDEVRKPPPAHARYLAWELELSGLVPVLGGYFVWAANIDRILDAPPDVHVYEEALRGVAQPPWIMSARAGYVHRFNASGSVKGGAFVEDLVLPGRSANMVRVGPALLVSLTDHLELYGVLQVPVSSPDSLGLILGTWAAGGLRYKWASGERHPDFP